MVGEPHVADAVARDVQHVDAGERPARHVRVAPLGGDGLRRAALEPRQRVGARAGDDPDRHRRRSTRPRSGRRCGSEPSSSRSVRKRSVTRRLPSASEAGAGATSMSGEDSRSPPTGCQCRPSWVTVSSGTITASETSAPTPRRSAKPRRTSGRTAKSSPLTPTPPSRPRSSATSPAFSGVSVIATRSGSPSAWAWAMPAIACSKAPAPRQRSCVAASRAVDRGLQHEPLAARQPRQLALAAAAAEQHRVGEADGGQPRGGVLEHVDDRRLDERLAAGDVDLLEALGDRLVDERAEALEPERAPCAPAARTPPRSSRRPGCSGSSCRSTAAAGSPVEPNSGHHRPPVRPSRRPSPVELKAAAGALGGGTTSRQVVHQPVSTVSANGSGRPAARSAAACARQS